MFYNSEVTKIHENGRTVSLASLAVPKFFEQISLIMLTTVNTLMLSGYSQDAVAAVTVAGQLENMIIILVNIIITGMVAVMSVELGRKDSENAGWIAGTALISTFVFSLILGLLASFLSDKLLEIMNLEGNVKNLSSEYFDIRCTFIFVIMLLSAFNNMLICNGYSAEALGVCILSNVLNVVFGYIVLFSGLDLPLKGVKGLAVMSLIAQGIALLVAAAIYMKHKCPFGFKFKKAAFKRIMRVGIPSGLGLISYTATQTISTGFIASMGVVTLNTKVYIDNIINYTSKIGWAVATSNAVLIGRYRGQGEFENIKILYRQNMVIAVLSNSILAVLAFVFHRPLISLFTNDESAFVIAASVMAVDIVVEIARAVNNISEQALNANGDVKTTFVVSLITCWLFGVLLTYILGIKCGLGLIGCWIGFAVNEAVKAILYSFRWESGKWKDTNI